MAKNHLLNTILIAICSTFCALFFPVIILAQDAPSYDTSVPEPSLSGIRYGEHERHILDFWKAESATPTPLVFVIHGGGWRGGEKERVHRFADVQRLLDAGISVAAINYRLMKHVEGKKIMPPVKAPMYDAARALQFVRSKAGEWNIDKQRIGAAGGSAGACTSLWLAYHDDLADPDSNDPVAWESTRLYCVAVVGPQTTLDPQQMKEWTPNSRYGGHAFGKKNFTQFIAERESILPWIAEYSPYALVSADDPPVYMKYNQPPALGQNQKDPTHTANFGVKLQERCKEFGIDCSLNYPDAPDVKHQTTTDYLIATLKGAAQPFTYLSNLKKEMQIEWPKNRTINIVFHGHSVPAGYFKTPEVNTLAAYPALVLKKIKAQYPFAVVNVMVTAIGGENSVRGANRFDKEVLTHQPDVLLIDYGLNDRGLALEESYKAWSSMIQKAKNQQIKVILLTPSPDQRVEYSDPGNALKKQTDQIISLAEEHQVGLVDSYQAFEFLYPNKKELKKYMSQVNHPNERGHELIANEIFKYFSR